jgi:hypothetical protein
MRRRSEWSPLLFFNQGNANDEARMTNDEGMTNLMIGTHAVLYDDLGVAARMGIRNSVHIGTCRKEAREIKHFLHTVRAAPVWMEAKKLRLIFSKTREAAKNE